MEAFPWQLYLTSPLKQRNNKSFFFVIRLKYKELQAAVISFYTGYISYCRDSIGIKEIRLREKDKYGRGKKKDPTKIHCNRGRIKFTNVKPTSFFTDRFPGFADPKHVFCRKIPTD